MVYLKENKCVSVLDKLWWSDQTAFLPSFDKSELLVCERVLLFGVSMTTDNSFKPDWTIKRILATQKM